MRGESYDDSESEKDRDEEILSYRKRELIVGIALIAIIYLLSFVFPEIGR